MKLPEGNPTPSRRRTRLQPLARWCTLACVSALPSLAAGQGFGAATFPSASASPWRMEALAEMLGASLYPLQVLHLAPLFWERTPAQEPRSTPPPAPQQRQAPHSQPQQPLYSPQPPAAEPAWAAGYATTAAPQSHPLPPPANPPEEYGQRPDFLPGPGGRIADPFAQPYYNIPPPEAVAPQPPAAYTPTPPPVRTMARPADLPGSIQVEIPLPPATAEPLVASESTPATAYPYQNDSVFLAQASEPPAYSAPFDAYPVPAQQAPAAQQPHIPRQIGDPSATTADIPPPSEDVSPAIIYDDAQQGVSRPAEPEPGPNISRMLSSRQYGEVEAIAATNRDSALASALGWARYRDGNNQLAYQWFEQALQWNTENNEAAYGMALTLFRMGRYDQAEQVARWRVQQYPRMQKVLADISSRRAVANLRSRDFAGSAANLDAAGKRRPLTREEKIVAAWNDYNAGKREKARQEFLKLYNAKPDRFAAHGLYTTYAADRDWEGLERIVEQKGGPIAKLYEQRIAEKYYDLGLHRMAYQYDPKRFKDLQGITSPSAAVDFIGRNRSGTDGTSQLSEYGARLRATIYAQARHQIDVAVGVTHLDAGQLQTDTRYGHYPPDGTPPGNYRYQPQTSYNGLVDARVRWEYQNFLTPSVELGISPIGGAVSPTIVGALGLRRAQTWGYWHAEVYRNSVKDSILSYTGLKDPYTGKTWGRVTETGGRFSVFNQMKNRWSFYGALSAGMLQGKNVPNNAHTAFALAVNKALDYEGFEFITLGPTLSFDFYNRNLSQFTYGQGGYFSPKYLAQVSMSGQFMTKQGGNSLLRGSASFGLQTNKQDSAPLFPNNPDGRWYSPISSSGVAIGLNLEGLTLLSENWALGGQIGVNVAPNYNDFSLRVSFQYFFERRHGLFAQDFFRF